MNKPCHALPMVDLGDLFLFLFFFVSNIRTEAALPETFPRFSVDEKTSNTSIKMICSREIPKDVSEKRHQRQRQRQLEQFCFCQRVKGSVEIPRNNRVSPPECMNRGTLLLHDQAEKSRGRFFITPEGDVPYNTLSPCGETFDSRVRITCVVPLPPRKRCALLLSRRVGSQRNGLKSLPPPTAQSMRQRHEIETTRGAERPFRLIFSPKSQIPKCEKEPACGMPLIRILHMYMYIYVYITAPLQG